MPNWKIAILLLLNVTLIFGGEEENVSVRVDQGLLKGKTMVSRIGRKYYGFFKVPYAKPPLGELRFKAPEEPENWEGIRDATTDDSVKCTQRNIYVKKAFFIDGEEDCLYMNIYTPKINPTDLLPVMVFIHGGGWVCGAGNPDYYSSQYLLDKDVVYVSFNYRLGPLGFLSMEDADLPGNNGLRDQNRALKWIQKNIRSFGGNPDSVTIFGESAGGASVHYQILSPQSRGLFHRGISQSGTSLCSWALAAPGSVRRNTIKLAKALKCPTSSTKVIVDCLRKKPAKDIIGTDLIFMEWQSEPMIPFKPVVEKYGNDRFIPEHPKDLIRKGKMADLPWITGLNSGEGALTTSSFFDDESVVKELNDQFEKIVPMSLFLRDNVPDVKKVVKSIKKFYFQGKKLSDETADKVTDLWSDGWFLAGANDAARLMQKHLKSPVYYYYFSYRGTISLSTVFSTNDRDYGVCHGDELLYLFPFQTLFANVTFSDADKKYMDLILDLWTNFAKFGEPKSDIVQEKWLPVSTDNLEYFHMGKGEVKMEVDLLPERSRFWRSITSEKNSHASKDEL